MKHIRKYALPFLAFTLLALVAVACKEEKKEPTTSTSSATASTAPVETTTDLSQASDPKVDRTILGTITGEIDGEEETSYIVREYHEDFDEPYSSGFWEGGGTGYRVTVAGYHQQAGGTARLTVHAYFDTDWNLIEEDSSFVRQTNWFTEPSEITATVEWMGEPGQDGRIKISGTFAGVYTDGDETMVVENGVFEAEDIARLGSL